MSRAVFLPGSPDPREALAAYCRGVASIVGKSVAPTASIGEELTPRLRQTLQGLLSGHSEKEVARHLSISRGTVHDYVKQIYRHYGVCSRAELMARLLAPDGRPT